MELSVKDRIKNSLREAMEGITRLESFDFDGTLIDTPLPEFGKPIWEKAYGKEYPHVGWWSKIESLDTSIFEMKALPQVAAAYKEAKSRPDTMTIMLTGRRNKEPLMSAVKGILSSKGMTFDQYLFNYGGETSANKIDQLNNILNVNPSIVEVVLFDDRDTHIPTFEAWGQSLLTSGRLTNFVMNHIKGDHHSPID